VFYCAELDSHHYPVIYSHSFLSVCLRVALSFTLHFSSYFFFTFTFVCEKRIIITQYTHVVVVVARATSVSGSSSDEVKVYHFTSGQLNGISWQRVGMCSLHYLSA